MYGKHFDSMYTGSMYGAGASVFAVWGWVICHARCGQVEINPTYLAPVLGMKVNEVIRAVDFLCSLDEHSRCKLQDGKRLVRIGEFSYEVPTHEIYRSMKSSEDRRVYNRDYMRNYRGTKPKNVKKKGLRSLPNTTVNIPDSASVDGFVLTSEKKESEKGKLLDLPDCVPRDAWDAFMDLRKQIHKPPSEHAKRLLIKKLLKFQEQFGNDPREILERSVMNGWQGIFELPKNQPERNNGNGKKQSSFSRLFGSDETTHR